MTEPITAAAHRNTVEQLVGKLKSLRKRWRTEATQWAKRAKQHSGLTYMEWMERAQGYEFRASELDEVIREFSNKD